MLSTSNVAVQFGCEAALRTGHRQILRWQPVWPHRRERLRKSTSHKVLGGELEQSAGDVMLQAGLRLGKLRQNQFGYEDQRVLDVVMQGHVEMSEAMQERDRIYANPQATDAEYMKAAELEGKFAEYGGYDAEARAGRHPDRRGYRGNRSTMDRCAQWRRV